MGYMFSPTAAVLHVHSLFSSWTLCSLLERRISKLVPNIYQFSTTSKGEDVVKMKMVTTV